ncbi:MAG: cation transporter [Alphaproteobacteria bacterium]
MAETCDRDCTAAPPETEAYRRALIAVLVINAVMFVIEAGAGLGAGSVSLQADALDFLGDAASYTISLLVLSMTIRWRAGAALIKGGSMGLFGLWVMGATIYNMIYLGRPDVVVMGSVGTLALAANVVCALILYRFREGDANMRSVWLCTRNDAIGNIAVLAAAGGVFASNTAWPDLAVAAVMAGLALNAAFLVSRHAMAELRHQAVT